MPALRHARVTRFARVDEALATMLARGGARHPQVTAAAIREAGALVSAGGAAGGDILVWRR
jgi:hypothetical protein